MSQTQTVFLNRRPLSRWIFLSLLLIGIPPNLPAEEPESRRPNIVLIMADDLGYETIGCNGGTSYDTPHLDAMAADGMRFTQAFSTPLCTPTRVQLLTGKYNHRNYVGFRFLRKGEQTFAHRLRAAGYATGIVGKWQLAGNARQRQLTGRTGTLPEEAGFTEYCLWQIRDAAGSRFKSPHISTNQLQPSVHQEGYGPDVFCSYAEDFFTRHRDRPFLLYYPMALTHAPFQPSPLHSEYENFIGGTYKSDRRFFADNVQYMDLIVGRLLRKLEELGIRENTLVLFTGDNGTDRAIESRLGNKIIKGQKASPTTAGTHVPLIASWPTVIAPGQVNNHLVDFTDFFPTLLEAGQALTTQDREGDGISFLPQLRHLSSLKPNQSRKWIYCDYNPGLQRFQPARYAQNHEWKLYGTGELYRWVDDPQETSAISRRSLNPEEKESVGQLQGVLEKMAGTEETRPPNVIFILTDDQGSVDMGAYGASDLKTKSMDRIARRGIRFTQFYSGAPVCSPSRASLLTGKTPQACGVAGNVSPFPEDAQGLASAEITMAEMFRNAGYRTALVGKWHLGHVDEKLPSNQGFDYWFGHLVGCIDNYSHFFYWNGPNRHDLYRNGGRVQAAGKYFPDLMFQEAKEFVYENRERPFFLYFASNAPHYPYQGDASWLRHYEKQGVSYPRNQYNAFLSSLDDRIGKLLDHLERLNLTENTIIVFQSDHGHSNEVRAHHGGGSSGPFRGAKFSLFEGGIRVPAIISWPGNLPENETRDQVAVAADWFPTLLDLCGLSEPEHTIDGKSLASLLRNADAPSPHERLHWQRGASWVVRQGPWKLQYDPRDTGVSENQRIFKEDPKYFLVNLEKDQGEQSNLAGQFPGLVEQMTQLHQDWKATWSQPEAKD